MIFKNISVKNFYILIFLSLFIVLNFSFNSFSQTAGQVPGSSLGLNSDADYGDISGKVILVTRK